MVGGRDDRSEYLDLNGGSKGDIGGSMLSLELLEAELAEAVRGEDYEAAARCRDRLNKMRMDSTLGVLECNNEFYRAFREGDFKAMSNIWLDDEDKVTCAHPATPVLCGRSLVIDSWQAILQSPPEIRVEQPKVVMYSSTSAAVICEEHLLASSLTQGPSAVCLATNIFMKTEGEGGAWRIVHHHAGPTLPQAMRVERIQ